jgi:CheY-like chemotaxis protein
MNHPDLTILIVEDNRINQLLLKEMLLKLGFSDFDIVENGKAALKKLSENYYDIILLDIQLPGMDGYEITREIRTKRTHRHLSVPIIALTGNASEKDQATARGAGINDYVIKPYTPENLYSTILKYEKLQEKKGNRNTKKIGRTTDSRSKKPNMDLVFLEIYTGGDKKVTIQLIEIFLREIPLAIEKLEQCIPKEKWKEVHAVSHKVKSTFAIFELTELKKTAFEIEKRSGELTGLELIPKLFGKFKSGCTEVLSLLEEELRKLKI